ncbi:NHLP leader peptide family natural product precursor [Microvirga tunisiensis]|uniref:NHLP leader peptide family natural product n=3 Tax=Pannonibacter tanglangensis TaxID=2750084 RepID=A0A7X5JAZ3_9HYPH|nr:NHLP leader peptide family natural product precursor [Pannonibacter sp. XCT-34]NBN79936.1 NHLP leader peptide family natural product precursor [Pannonibacter sp. XCT-53]
MATARQNIQRALIEKASEDAAFRQKLIDNPHAALRELIGTDPIPSVTIRVIEEQPGEVTLVLPRNMAEDELPDELLDLASGGTLFMAFLEWPMTTKAKGCPKT